MYINFISRSSRKKHIKPHINEKIAIKLLSELMDHIIKEGGSIEGLMFSEKLMTLVIVIILYF